MTCAESKNLILMRDDELTKEQREWLGRHIKTCADCTAYMLEVKSMTLRFEKLRLFQPILKNPETLTSDILNKVDKTRRSRSTDSPAFADGLLEFLSRRGARIAYGTFVLGSVGIFLIQQLGVAADVQSLEKRMVQRRDENAAVQVVYAVPSNLVDRLPQTQQVRSYFGSAKAEEQDGLFVISKRSLSKAVDLMGGVIFRSNNPFSNDASRRSIETLAETLERSASSRVIIRP